jgi:hypothetical protein
MQSTTNPSPRRRWNAVADLPTYKAGDAADLKSELIKAGGSALVKLLLKLVNWVWNWRPCPQRGRKVIVNQSWRQLPGNYRGSPWYQRKMFTNMLRKRMESRAPARGSGGVQKQKILHRQLVCASSKRLARPTKPVYAFFLTQSV